MSVAVADKPHKRTPRFRRIEPPAFEVTERDLDILRAAAQFRIIQSTHLDVLLPQSSEQKLRRRLQLLFHAGYLGRPRCQVAAMLDSRGSRSLAYVLTRRGARLLELHGTAASARTDERELGQLEHSLAVTDFLVTATVACRSSAFLEFVPFDELITSAPAETQAAPLPDRWKVEVRYGSARQVLHLRPDGIFAVRHRQLAAAGKPALKHFFFEKDRGTMPIVRDNLTQTSILRKLITYGATFRAGIHSSRFAMGNMRVLFLTENPERVEHIIEAYQKYVAQAASPRLFLFTDRESLAAAPSFFESLWLDGEGKEHTLFD